jgi:hypothetical protein
LNKIFFGPRGQLLDSNANLLLGLNDVLLLNDALTSQRRITIRNFRQPDFFDPQKKRKTVSKV